MGPLGAPAPSRKHPWGPRAPSSTLIPLHRHIKHAGGARAVSPFDLQPAIAWGPWGDEEGHEETPSGPQNLLPGLRAPGLPHSTARQAEAWDGGDSGAARHHGPP